MSGGLATTWKLLAQTTNEAAVGVLAAALQAADPAIRDGALRALLQQRNPAAQRELLRRWDTLDEPIRAVLARHSDRLSRALRDAILGSDPQMRGCACEAALWVREYDLLPALIHAAEDRSRSDADLAAAALLALTQLLEQELTGPGRATHRRDLPRIKEHVLDSLQSSLRRFDQHRRLEIVEALLMLAPRDNPVLQQVLQNPHDPAYRVLIETLTSSTRPYVMRLLLQLLDDPHTPSSVVTVAAHRCDVPFLRRWLRKIGHRPSDPARQNLKRIERIAWLSNDRHILSELNDAEQHAAVELVMASGMPRQEVFGVLQWLLDNGSVGGRRAAAAALVEFPGAAANALALAALDDNDPQVQANALAQLRGRGIPTALPRLLASLDSPHPEVRRTAQQCLAEFTFQRFLASFEMLDEQVRRNTGRLVRKIDPSAIPELAQQLVSPSRTARLRALQVAPALDAVAELQSQIVQLLGDPDHFIRAEAARALSQSPTAAVRKALEGAAQDRSLMVQQAVKQTLQQQDAEPPSQHFARPPELPLPDPRLAAEFPQEMP